MQRSSASRLLGAALAVLPLGVSLPALAQSAATPTVRFSIDPAAFDDVATSTELVQALRDDMRISMTAPDDGYLWADIRGYAGEADSSSVARFSYLHRVGLNPGGQIADHSWADAIRETHEDVIGGDADQWYEMDTGAWTTPADEEAAWAQLLRSIDQGLARSSDDFGELPEGQHHPLRVTSVDIREFTGAGAPVSPDGLSIFECCDGDTGLEGPVLMFKPDITTGLEDPGDVPLSLNAVIISLEATQPAPPPAASAPDSQVVANALAAEACKGLGDGGSASLEIGGRVYEGTAVVRPFREDMTLISMGSATEGEATPSWCLALASFGPMETTGEVSLSAPGAWAQAATGWTASLLNLEAGGVRFHATRGTADVTPGQPLSIALDAEGMLTAPQGEPREVRVEGMIEAIPGE